MGKRKIIIAALCLAAGLAALSAAVYAAVSYGSQDDPLITKSYLDKVLRPQLEEEFRAELDAALEDAAGGETGGGGGDYVVISLKSGQTVSCGVGCEVMLRIGSASAQGADYPVLVDTTTGESVADGSAMKANHLYMVTIAGNGFRATAATTKLLIRGEYTVK